jgi:hypothetical protein
MELPRQRNEITLTLRVLFSDRLLGIMTGSGRHADDSREISRREKYQHRLLRPQACDNTPQYNPASLTLDVRRLLADAGIATTEGSDQAPDAISAARCFLVALGVRPGRTASLTGDSLRSRPKAVFGPSNIHQRPPPMDHQRACSSRSAVSRGMSSSP